MQLSQINLLNLGERKHDGVRLFVNFGSNVLYGPVNHWFIHFFPVVFFGPIKNDELLQAFLFLLSGPPARSLPLVITCSWYWRVSGIPFKRHLWTAPCDTPTKSAIFCWVPSISLNWV